MPNFLTANRVAAIAAFSTGLAGAVLAITNTFPHNWQQASIAIAGILGAIGTALHFMLGSQKMDQNNAQVHVAEAQLQEARHYNEITQRLDQQNSGNVSNETVVTDVTGGQEAPPAISEEELAVPEDLNPEQWLANRDPGTQDQITTASTDTATTAADQSEGIEEPTNTTTPDVS